MGATATNPIRRILAPAGLGLGLLLGAAPTRAAGWPALPIDPVPREATPEVAPATVRARGDSVRAILDTLLARGPVPAPPRRPDARLVRWIVEIVSFPRAGEIDRFADAAEPRAWADADTAGRLPLAAAMALHEAGRDREALRWLDEGRAGPTDLPYRRLLAVELEDAVRDSSAAVREAEKIRSDFPRADWTLPAAIRLMRARESAGDYEALLTESLRTRRTLGAGSAETAARFRACTRLGRATQAGAVADTLLRSYPGGDEARDEALMRMRAGARAAALREGTVLVPVLLRHRLFAAADTLLTAMPRADSLRVVRLEGMLQARRYEEILADRGVRPDRLRPPLRARFDLVEARAARNSGAGAPMARFYARAAALGGETRRVALSEWAREAESGSRERLADSLYTALLRMPGGEEEARFRRAIARYAAGRVEAALADLALLRRGEWGGAAAFWRYRIEGARGNRAAADRALDAAASAAGYYQERALAERAWRSAPGAGGSFWKAEDAILFARAPAARQGSRAVACGGTAKLEDRAERIRLLRRFGRGDWAERETGKLEADLPGEGRARLLLCLGLPDLAIRVAIGRGEGREDLRYPRCYAGEIERDAAEAGVAPELVWAIARRESLFDSGARSGAGARGLLQLVEKTARETAERWKIPAAPLQRADVNLAIGIRHLKDLREQHPWSLPAILAAYNAGAPKAAEWVERFPDPDLLIERIGWHETRAYVQNVLEACWIYRSAYADSTAARAPR